MSVVLRPTLACDQRGQILPVVLLVILALFMATFALSAFGGAFVARDEYQKAVDLAAMSAARQMRADYARLFVPPNFPNGAANPRHLPLAAYKSRASGVAVEVARSNDLKIRRRDVLFPPGFAPTSTTVRIRGELRVPLSGHANSQVASSHPVAIRAVAEASFQFRPSVIGQTDALLPSTASGGGYDGPLAHRQGMSMRPDVAAAYDRLATAARRTGLQLRINSAYRSDAEQARLFAAHPDPKWVARPGTSLHRHATELDLGPPVAYRWLAANARRYGFIKRYAWEAWHFGYGANPRVLPADYGNGSHESEDGDRPRAPGLPSFVPEKYADEITAASQRWNVPARVLAAQLYRESGFNPNAQSGAGAQGIAQFMPATARSYGLSDPFDPKSAIMAQARLMSDLLTRFKKLPLALAAYNAGPGAVERFGGIPPYAETQTYVASIIGLLNGQLGTGLPASASGTDSLTELFEVRLTK